MGEEGDNLYLLLILATHWTLRPDQLSVEAWSRGLKSTHRAGRERGVEGGVR